MNYGLLILLAPWQKGVGLTLANVWRAPLIESTNFPPKVLARAPTHITLNNLTQTHKAMSIPSPSFPYSLPPSPSPTPYPHSFFSKHIWLKRAVRHPFWQGIWDRLACPFGKGLGSNTPFNNAYKLLPMCCTLLARGDGWFAGCFGEGFRLGWSPCLVKAFTLGKSP